MKKESANVNKINCHPELDSGSPKRPPSASPVGSASLMRFRIKPGMTEESGRSMVEMLGVLAIIGVLSVMGIAGYRSAITKMRSNELLNEASKRAVVVAGQITLHGHSPSLSEFNETDFSGGSFSETVYGASGENPWSDSTTDKKFTLAITGVEGAICEQMQGIAADNAIIKGFAPNSCDSDNPNTVKLTYNNDLSTDTIPSGDNNTGNAPTTPSTCAANDMYWCPNSQTCVANQAACLALCPTERQCGDTCCGEGNICLDGNKCCYGGDEDKCCNASESSGWFGEMYNGEVEGGDCCGLNSTPYVYYDEGEGGSKQVACCANNLQIFNYPEFPNSAIEYPQYCCDEGSAFFNINNGGCCPKGSIGIDDDGECCEAGTIMLEDVDAGEAHCCPAGSTGYTAADGCCEVGTIVIQDENEEKHCCPANSTGFDTDSWKCV